MKYDVTLRGPRGAADTVTVEAASGDEAASKAFKSGWAVCGVHPAAPAKAKRA